MVGIYYYGKATDAALKQHPELKQLPWMDLTPHKQHEFSGGGHLVLPAPQLDAQRVAMAEPGQYRVSINVWSGRRRYKDNIFACASYDGTFDEVRRAAVQVPCERLRQGR